MTHASRRQPRFTYANIMSTIAVVAVMGTGSAFAATNLVGGSGIKDNSITGADIKNNSIGALDLTAQVRKQLSSAGADGKDGAPGDKGERGPAGEPGTGGKNGTAGASAWDPIPSGTVLTGGFYDYYDARQVGDHHAIYEQIPGKLSTPLNEVGFGDGAGNVYTDLGSEITGCTGSVATPTAPSGKVCVYLDAGAYGVNTVRALPWSSADGLARGQWTISWIDSVGNTLQPVIWGSWAYTAP